MDVPNSPPQSERQLRIVFAVVFFVLTLVVSFTKSLAFTVLFFLDIMKEQPTAGAR